MLEVEKKNKLALYQKLFLAWNEKFNISSRKLSAKQLADKISESQKGGIWLTSENIVADVGTGGGLPGVPLAILLPKVRFILLDSSRKKCSFLRLVKHSLGLTNVEIENTRIEKAKKFPCIVSQAAFPPAEVSLLGEHVEAGGKLILYSTLKERDALVSSLSPCGLRLMDMQDYQKEGDEPRAIYLFERPMFHVERCLRRA